MAILSDGRRLAFTEPGSDDEEDLDVAGSWAKSDPSALAVTR
jgi:hypothetical protein